MRSERIEKMRRRFKARPEWLLIEVRKKDHYNQSIAGKLLAHSPVRDEIYKKLITVKSRYPVAVKYSETRLPKGVAVAFHVCR